MANQDFPPLALNNYSIRKYEHPITRGHLVNSRLPDRSRSRVVAMDEFGIRSGAVFWWLPSLPHFQGTADDPANQVIGIRDHRCTSARQAFPYTSVHYFRFRLFKLSSGLHRFCGGFMFQLKTDFKKVHVPTSSTQRFQGISRVQIPVIFCFITNSVSLYLCTPFHCPSIRSPSTVPRHPFLPYLESPVVLLSYCIASQSSALIASLIPDKPGRRFCP